MLRVGDSTLGAWIKTQATVAPRSGEAEFASMHQGVVAALAARSLLSEVFGKQSEILVHAGSSAAQAMAPRVGLGRVKHIV